jgi:hypothetical protein
LLFLFEKPNLSTMKPLVVAAFLLLTAAVVARGQDAFDQPPISYSSAVAHDPVERLKKRLAGGEIKLEYSPKRGYLESILKLLDIPASSQTLVFSKTSFQHQRISPDNPRAIYFNDDTYVGYVPGGEDLEIATTDPRLGPVFYMIEQTPPAAGGHADLVARETANCLQCHAGGMTQNQPGLIMRSTFPDSDGLPILSAGTFLTTIDSPIKDRWGGWLVTGVPAAGVGMGNAIYESQADQTAKRTDEVKLTNGPDYLSRNSDALALMVLGAQTDLHNRFTRAVYGTELAIRDEKALADALGEKPPAGKHSDSTVSRIKSACEPLVQGLLYVDQIPPPSGLSADSDFARDFCTRGPRSKDGRSLRDFDLQKRLFKYPCSYLIYSDSFEKLPQAAKDYVYQRLFDVLSGKDKSEDFARLTPEDREAVLEILQATKKDLPGYWAKAQD